MHLRLKNTVFSTFIVALTFLVGCNDSYKVIESNSRNEVVTGDFSTPDSLYALVVPYKSALETKMNEVLNTSLVDMEIGTPEGVLGNFVADLVLEMGREKIDKEIVLAVLNNGGLRAPIVKGNVTRGMIYELMPFENELVVLELDGAAMEEMIQYIAEHSLNTSSPKAGVPVSGIRIRMSGIHVSEVFMGDELFDANKTYKIITSDYLALGGDNMTFFQGARSNTSSGIKLRDAIIEHVQKLGTQNIELNATLDGRIYLAE